MCEFTEGVMVGRREQDQGCGKSEERTGGLREVVRGNRGDGRKLG